MPSPATKITSSHEVTWDPFLATVCVRNGGCCDLVRKGPSAPTRLPKGYPCAKTLCMAEDCHKTWHCSAMAELPFCGRFR
eukprot:5598877-Amphidinium_carterae.1